MTRCQWEEGALQHIRHDPVRESEFPPPGRISSPFGFIVLVFFHPHFLARSPLKLRIQPIAGGHVRFSFIGDRDVIDTR